MTETAWTVLDDHRCVLGEGPTYDPVTGTAWWFDILGKRLFEHRLAKRRTLVHPLPELSSAIARVDDHRQLLVTETGLYLRDVRDGRLALHRPLEADNAATRSNDSRVHPCGALWVGTMGKSAEEGAGSIHWYFRGELRTLFTGITVTNAISFSPDGRLGYFTDTPTRQIMRVALDPETGLPTGTPEPFSAPSQNGEPDGAVTDAAGNLWVARWGGGGVEVMSPEGVLLRKLPLPASLTTCPAFVGAEGDRLLVTSASVGLDPEAEGNALAGCTFLFDLDAPVGRFDPAVRLN
ncbi:SMP-30/gluconolactonase/LRE family protein [Nitratireductor sp. ZSWI3]|uniref:SMP-30/gluconolactonase/LRE family protein n=1 Tax=Nitratireductor sp. ZSWI3 TaxID=2966359 RepID=UPI00214FA4BF|nr:SMP-30/gluconolactonase/LRE family protein [Nitratireductor sp. ZSWI3]MCR4268461.1 SMP-30/gluconolactonase/LRE family protein [Nitratireductor sp. ZSWI3]